MTFISHAQNFEDVMLWRALGHVEAGFYIDVGANDPDVDSVTRAFYERGWRGINIEPISQWFEKLAERRPNDLNLNLAAGAEKGELVIYELPDTGLSTVKAETAAQHERARGYTKLERRVPVDTLTAICEREKPEAVHFLKVDVEGAEKDVLLGLDLGRIRPWIILVEATLPNSPVEDYADWEPLILAHGYRYVYFDGLNRFYLADEHPELARHFKAPPNVFDGFVLEALVSARAHEPRARAAEARASELERRVFEAEARAASQAQRAAEAEARAEAQARHRQAAETRAGELEARAISAEAHAARMETVAHQLWEQATVLQGTLSWRVTAPLRAVRKLAVALLESPWGRAKHLVRPYLLRAMRFLLKRPALKRACDRVLRRFPALRARLMRMAYRPAAPAAPPPPVTSADELSPRARQILAALKTTFDPRRQEGA